MQAYNGSSFCTMLAQNTGQDALNLNLILGGLVGVVAAACVGLLLFYMKRHPQKVMKVCLP